MSALAALPGEREGPVGAGAGVLDVSREPIPLADLDETGCVEIPDPRGVVVGQGLLQPGEARLDAPQPRIHLPQRRHGMWRKRCERPIATERDRAVGRADSPIQISPDAVNICQSHARLDETERMIQRFCDADAVLSVSLAFVEDAP